MAVLEKSLDFTWQRQKLITENIANVDTPGYKAKHLDFENRLAQSMEAVQSGLQGRETILNTRAEPYQDRRTSTRADGANVDMDAENVLLAKNQIQYEYLLRQMDGEFARFRLALG